MLDEWLYFQVTQFPAKPNLQRWQNIKINEDVFQVSDIVHAYKSIARNYYFPIVSKAITPYPLTD